MLCHGSLDERPEAFRILQQGVSELVDSTEIISLMCQFSVVGIYCLEMRNSLL
jgi:hypothetical protein